MTIQFGPTFNETMRGTNIAEFFSLGIKAARLRAAPESIYGAGPLQRQSARFTAGPDCGDTGEGCRRVARHPARRRAGVASDARGLVVGLELRGVEFEVGRTVVLAESDRTKQLNGRDVLRVHADLSLLSAVGEAV